MATLAQRERGFQAPALRVLVLCLFALIATLLLPTAARAAEEEALRPLVQGLAGGGFAQVEAAVGRLAATGDPRVGPILEALAAGDLFARKSDGLVVLTRPAARRNLQLLDPLTGEALETVAGRELDRVRVNNPLRRTIRLALGRLTLGNPDPAVRRAAAETLFRSREADSLEVLDAVLAEEANAQVRRVMEQARAAVLLFHGTSEPERLAAVATIRARGDREALALLRQVAAQSEGAVEEEADAGVRAIERTMLLWDAGQHVVYGLSLASVLLLAAIGLSITFGVMGVINMAHGEMVMLGAYTTFVVQQALRTYAPELLDWALLPALPLAFLVGGAVGVLIERSVIRWLYGRPLETLLATWGLALVLQQAVRTIFGPTNREVSNPSWMSGAFRLGELTITYNRLWIFLFAALVFLLLYLVIRRTAFGLQMRAVTQNRAMARSMGIRSSWVDSMTFGLGSGIASIAGVALSQIDNVSPNLGQSYIIDSFLVVVFGGVGNLWGTLVGAISLGVVNKFLEPYAGAVLGKILVLVLVILFIQKRPRGLFALRGRAVES